MKFNRRYWFLVHCIAWTMGIIFSLIISSAVESIFKRPVQFYLGHTMGFSIGLAQWFLLRKALGISWIIGSCLIMGGGMFLFEWLNLVSEFYQLPISVLVGAFSLALWQVFYLKLSKSIALRWMFSGFIAWVMSVFSVFLINYTMQIKSIELNLVIATINLLLILSGGIFHGILTFYPMKKIVDAMDK